MTDKENIKPGMRVTYCPAYLGGNFNQQGIVKSVGARFIFIVFHCDGDWDNYHEYTPAATRSEDVTLGWEGPENER